MNKEELQDKLDAGEPIDAGDIIEATVEVVDILIGALNKRHRLRLIVQQHELRIAKLELLLFNKTQVN